MSRCRALNIAACLTALAVTAPVSAAVAQTAWPAPQQQQAPSAWPAPQTSQPQQQAPAGAWPAPQAAQPAPSRAWPAPQAAPSQAPSQPAFVPPAAGFGPSLAVPQQQQQEPPCLKDFVKLRTDAEKKRGAIEQAGKKKVGPAVACRLFNDYSASEVRLIKFVTENTDKCGMPKELLDNLTKGHAQTSDIRTRVCAVAAAPPKPAGPTLSDVLSAPVPDSSNTRKGRGTFDTLSGSPLAR
jgi:hypothetical protein